MTQDEQIIISGFKESFIELKEQQHPQGKEKKFYIEGLAVPFDKVSSNGVLYKKESLIQSIPEWTNVPIMYNHLIEGKEYPVGKVVGMKVGNYNGTDGLIYKAEIDPQETMLINKIKGGYLSKVSIHILPNTVESKDTYQEATVQRPLELSIVPVPGFRETNMAAYMEKIKVNINKGDVMMIEKTEQTATNVKSLETVKETVFADTIKENKISKEELKARITEKLNNKIQKIKEQKLEEMTSLKEIQSENKLLKENLKKLTSIVEEMVLEDEKEENEVSDIIAQHEVTLDDVADILNALTNRLDRIEKLLKKNEEHNVEEEKSEVTGTKKKELPSEEKLSETPVMESQKKRNKFENVVVDERTLAKENLNKITTTAPRKTVTLRDLF